MSASQAFDPGAYDPTKEIGICNWPPPTSPALAGMTPKALKVYTRDYRWMAYAARINRVTPGWKNDWIPKSRWAVIAGGYDIDTGRAIGHVHRGGVLNPRTLETLWHHTRRDMLTALRVVGLVAPLSSAQRPLPAANTPPAAVQAPAPVQAPVPVQAPAHPNQSLTDDEQYFRAVDIATKEGNKAYNEAYVRSLRNQGFEPRGFES